MKPTDSQQQIIDKVVDDIKEVRNGDIFAEHSWISIKGAAGTGKTFITKNIVSHLLDMNMSICAVAPTHQATKVIRNTIGIDDKRLVFTSLHSFLGLKPGKINVKTGERKFVRETNKKRSEISTRKFDICILDESSMVSHELFTFLKEEMYQNSRIKSFLFIGDEFQLLPVNDNTKKHAIYNNNNINHYTLTELIRNTDMEVIDFVTKIRDMIASGSTKFDLFNYLVQERDKGAHNKIKFYKTKKEFISKFIEEDRLGSSDDCIATFTNANVELYNTKIRNFYVKTDGFFPEIHPEDLFVVQQSTQEDVVYGQNSFANSEILKLKMSNFDTFDFKGKLFKGYKCVTTDSRKFNKLADESKDDYERACALLKANAIQTKSGVAWKMYYDLLGLFMDVRPQFSSTTHKLQGSSYGVPGKPGSGIYVDMSDLGYVEDNLLLRLFYVAITRSRNEVHILL